MTFIRPRLRKPLVYALAGTALAVAWAVRGSHHELAGSLPGAGGDWRWILP